MTNDSNLAREYVKLRAEYPTISARNAFIHARGIAAQKERPELNLAYGAPATVKLAEGFAARVEIDYDADADYSHIGEFNWLRRGEYHGEAVDSFGRDMDRFIMSNGRGDVCEFVPAEKFADLLKFYRDEYGRNGYARAIEQRKSEVKEARDVLRGDRSQYVVTATVTLRGVELGHASVGGIDVSDSRDAYLSECAHDMIAEALKEAHATRAKLCCTNH